MEPGWLTIAGMLLAAALYHPHQIEDLLMAVEWDMILFFVAFFLLVGSLEQLGVVREIGDALTEAVLGASEDARMLFALALFIWVAALGSVFLDSLPYTTAIIAVLL